MRLELLWDCNSSESDLGPITPLQNFLGSINALSVGKFWCPQPTGLPSDMRFRAGTSAVKYLYFKAEALFGYTLP